MWKLKTQIGLHFRKLGW